MAKRRVKRSAKRAAPKRRPAPKRRVVRRAPKRVVRRSAPKRVVRRKSSRLSVVKRPVKTRFRNRFAKFYWLHRDAFNARRKRLYHDRKRGRECVKCGNKRVGKSIFCATHLRTSRVYNRRSRARR